MRHYIMHATSRLAASGGVGTVAASPVEDDELVELDVVVGVSLAAPAEAL